MDIKAEEISKIIRDQIGSYAVDVDVAEVGTIVSIGDGIARVHGVENTMAGEMLEFPHGIYGIALNLEEESVGAVLLGDYTEIKEGDTVKRTGRIISVPVGPELVGRVVNALGQPIDGKGPIVSKKSHADRAHRSRRRRSLAGQGADADRAEGDRRDGPDRPRPARADHRRPPDGQDRRRRRRDHQPARPGHDLHLQRDRPEAVDGRAGRADARGSRRDGIHHRRLGRRVGSGAAPLHQPVLGLHDGRVLPRQRPARAGDLRRPLEARAGLPRDLAAAAPSAGPRGLPGRRLLPALAPAGARREAEEGARRRLADGAADHRDAGGRPLGLHPDQRHLDHRRADLPGVGPVPPGRPSRDQRRQLGQPRRRIGAGQGDAPGRRHAAPRPRAVPRARRVRAVRLRPRQVDDEPAQSRPPAGRSAEAAAVPAAAGREAGHHHLRRDQRLPRSGAGRAGARVRDGALQVPRHAQGVAAVSSSPRRRRSTTRSSRS